MHDDENCLYRDRAEYACGEIESALDDLKLNTDQMAHFWTHLTEQCTVRLIRLRPEIVTRGPAPD
jgi:hypothetical protein